MAGYSARPGYCESCGAEIAPIDWQRQERGVACADCTDRERLHDVWQVTVDGGTSGAVAGEAAKSRYSVSEVVTLVLCVVPLATAVLGFGYVFVDDVLKIIGVR